MAESAKTDLRVCGNSGMKAWSGSGVDVTFVMTIYNEGWILDKIANHIALEMESRGLITTKYFLYGGNNLHNTFPPSDIAFFMHYSNYYHLANSIENSVGSYSVVWYTHFDEKHGIELDEFANLCNEYDTKVLCPCSTNKQDLLDAGIRPENVTVILGGYDETLLELEGPREKNKVAFVSACYERKRPDILIDLAVKCPSIEFNIVGPRADDVDNINIVWSRSKYAQEISRIPNINLHEVRYEDYPKLMLQNSKYLMVSDFEGGPIGLIEAMALDLVPVATDTGFVKDLLTGDLRDNILPISPTTEEVERVLFGEGTAGLARNRVRDASWKSFSKNVFEFLYIRNPDFPTYLTQQVLSKASQVIENHIFFRFLGAETALRNKGDCKGAAEIVMALHNNFKLSDQQRRALCSRVSLNMAKGGFGCHPVDEMAPDHLVDQ